MYKPFYFAKVGLPIYAFYSYFRPSKEITLISLLFLSALSYLCSTLHDCVFLPLCYTVFIFVLLKQAYKTVFLCVCFIILGVYFLPSCSPVFLPLPADFLPLLITSSAFMQHTHTYAFASRCCVWVGTCYVSLSPSFPLVFPLFSLDDFLNHRASFLLPVLSSSVLSQFPCFYLLGI